MHVITHNQRPFRIGVVLPLFGQAPRALALALLAIAGCGEGDSGAVSVKEAADTLAALHAGGAAVPAAELRQATYEKVAGMASRAQGEPGADPSTAASLAAQAASGLGDLAAAEASDRERDLTAIADRLRADFDFRQAQMALAIAFDRQAAAIDVAAEDKRIAELEAQITKVGERVKSRKAAIEALKQQAADASANAHTARGEEGKLRAAAAALSPRERGEILQQAFEAQRQADSFEGQSSILLAQVASKEPLLNEARQENKGLETRLSLARKTRKTAAERKTSLRTDAAEVRADAGSAEARVVATLEEIMAARKGDLSAAYKRAADNYERAIAQFRRAAQGVSSDLRSTYTMQRGVTAQRLAGVLAARADAAASLLAVMRNPLQATPAFDAASDVQSAFDALDSERRAALLAANQSLQDAFNAFDSAAGGLRGGARERMDALVSVLRARVAKGASENAVQGETN